MPHRHGEPAPTARLPRNQALVLAQLRRAGAPRTAYELLDALRDEGVRAPLTVYRALEALRRSGHVHKIESMKAFVACCEEEHAARPAFAVCDRCGRVLELEDPDLVRLLGAIAERNGFTVSRTLVELTGACAACAGKTDRTEPAP